MQQESIIDFNILMFIHNNLNSFYKERKNTFQWPKMNQNKILTTDIFFNQKLISDK